MLQSFESLSRLLNTFNSEVRVWVVIDSFKDPDLLDLTTRGLEARGESNQLIKTSEGEFVDEKEGI